MHLLNALKYASAFPVILLSAMQRTYISPVEDKYPDKVWFGESMLFRLWYSTFSLSSLTQDSLRRGQFSVFLLVGRCRRLESHYSNESLRTGSSTVGSSKKHTFL